MSDHKGNTGKSNKIKLKSSIDRVIWTAGIGCNGAEVGLEINTHFVGNNSEVKIEISDASGKVLDTIKTKIAGNYFFNHDYLVLERLNFSEDSSLRIFFNSLSSTPRFNVPLYVADTLPVSSDTTITIASVSSVSPTAAL